MCAGLDVPYASISGTVPGKGISQIHQVIQLKVLLVIPTYSCSATVDNKQFQRVGVRQKWRFLFDSDFKSRRYRPEHSRSLTSRHIRARLEPGTGKYLCPPAG